MLRPASGRRELDDIELLERHCRGSRPSLRGHSSDVVDLLDQAGSPPPGVRQGGLP
jgi:hypothetical protein